MSIALIQDRLATYGCASTLEEDRAIREITQEVVLAALARTDFFRHAAFQGGTCLAPSGASCPTPSRWSGSSRRAPARSS